MNENLKKTRGKNKNFYHFRLQELDPIEENKYLDYQYFKTANEICEKYGICRASLYRVLNNPLVKTSIPFRIERVYIHKEALNYLE